MGLWSSKATHSKSSPILFFLDGKQCLTQICFQFSLGNSKSQFFLSNQSKSVSHYCRCHSLSPIGWMGALSGILWRWAKLHSTVGITKNGLFSNFRILEDTGEVHLSLHNITAILSTSLLDLVYTVTRATSKAGRENRQVASRNTCPYQKKKMVNGLEWDFEG